MKTDWPKVASASGLHETVFSLIVELQNATKRRSSKVLDLPCGAGNLSRQFNDAGFTVVPSDIDLNTKFYGSKSSFVQADANIRLPFDDCFFDFVVSVEGIEHLENPSLFIREMERVLTPNGFGVITTPNVDSYQSKKNSFFKGYPTYFSPKSPGTKDSGHLLPCDIVFMRGAIRRANLNLVRVMSNEGGKRRSLRSKLFRRIFATRWPLDLGQEVPFYGENLIYLVQKNSY